jgi:L-ribulose-5-phosphate 3-epimerase
MERREFLAVAAASVAAAQTAGTRLPIKKGILYGMLPKNLTVYDRFKLAKDVGFEEMEVGTVADEKDADEIKKASEAAQMPIHSVMNMAHWKNPLSSGDWTVVAESVKGMEASLNNAKHWGASAVLLVPAVVNPQTSYKDAWERSFKEIKKLLPMAAKMKVVIAVEDVWNKFLLSPLEFARYVDEFKSPWLRAYFDVGNIVFYGYPQDWIRTLGKRIAKLHLKDFKFEKGRTEWTQLREGAIDWQEVYRALKEIGFQGTATVELAGGDEAYLKDVSRRVDLILTGA